MRILYHHRIGSKDGQYVHVEALIRAFEALGHTVTVIGPQSTGEQPFGGESRWVRRLKDTLPRVLYELLELAYSVRDYVRLRHAIRTLKPDFIYERYNLYFVSGVWARRRCHVPLLVEVNAPLADERARYGGLALPSLARWSERRVWRAADHVFAVTAVLAARIVAETGMRARVSVTPNGVDLARFAALPGRREAKVRFGWDGRIVLGFVGFVRAWHHLERVINLIARRRDLPLQLVLVGDGPDRARLERLAVSLDVAAQVAFCGLLPRERIPARVAAFDIALQPGVVGYASPLKLFEYMAAGCAIVAPATDNIREVLRHGHDALLFAPDDPVALTEQVVQLAEDPALRERLGAAARRTVIDRNLTWEHNARTVVAVAAALAGRTHADQSRLLQGERT